MSTKKLIRIDELSPADIARAKRTIRESWEAAQAGISLMHYGLVTAQIEYYVPYGAGDKLVRANTYIWQELDVLPTCPLLERFLAWWRTTLDGQIYKIDMQGAPLLNFAELGIRTLN